MDRKSNHLRSKFMANDVRFFNNRILVSATDDLLNFTIAGT